MFHIRQQPLQKLPAVRRNLFDEIQRIEQREENIFLRKHAADIRLPDLQCIEGDGGIITAFSARQRVQHAVGVRQLHLHLHFLAIGVLQPVAGFFTPEGRAAKGVGNRVRNGRFALPVAARNDSQLSEIYLVWLLKPLEALHGNADNMDFTKIMFHRLLLSLRRHFIIVQYVIRTVGVLF